jgi:hypothetical protein
MGDRFVLQEKLVRFAMSFMSKGTATQWAEWHASADLFPFPTWTKFEAEFRLRFMEENEQDQALTKLESHSYFQGSHDIYRHMDDFEELAVTAGYSDALVQVTKYRSGLDPKINVTITTSGTAPNLTDYDGWHARFPAIRGLCPCPGRKPFGSASGCLSLAACSGSISGFSSGPIHAPVSFALLPAPVRFQQSFQWMLTGLGHARSHAPASDAVCWTPRRECPVTSDVWHTDVLDEVICQLGDDLLDELFAHLATSASLPAESADEDTDPGFPPSAE